MAICSVKTQVEARTVETGGRVLVMLSGAKHLRQPQVDLARYKSEILRFAQNDNLEPFALLFPFRISL